LPCGQDASLAKELAQFGFVEVIITYSYIENIAAMVGKYPIKNLSYDQLKALIS